MSSNEIVRVVGVQRIIETERGLKVKFPGEKDGDGVWLPLSQVDGTDLTTDGQVGWVDMPYWLAEDRDLEGAVDADQDAGSPPAEDVSSSPESDSGTASSNSESSDSLSAGASANADSKTSREGGASDTDEDTELPF